MVRHTRLRRLWGFHSVGIEQFIARISNPLTLNVLSPHRYQSRSHICPSHGSEHGRESSHISHLESRITNYMMCNLGSLSPKKTLVQLSKYLWPWTWLLTNPKEWLTRIQDINLPNMTFLYTQYTYIGRLIQNSIPCRGQSLLCFSFVKYFWH